jgi:hypothetical protein
MNNGLHVERWSFWSPQSRIPAEWRERMHANIAPLPVPDDAIPAQHRRRMSALSRLAVQLGLEVTTDRKADFLVFCSQHGELTRTHGLLGDIASGQELSPAAFSQSVHNTSAGLYTIVSGSRAPASSVASGASTFAYGWLEADAYLMMNPEHCALLVCYEDVLPAEYLPYAKHEHCSYGLALRLGAAPGRDGVRLELVEPAAEEPLPLAPLFILWWLSTERVLRLTTDGQGWRWSRASA